MEEEKQKKLIELVENFCDAKLDNNYKILSRKLVEEMGKMDEVPFKIGKLEIWASAVICALGQINFLFDNSSEPYITRKGICKYFGTKLSAVGSTTQRIIKMFNLEPVDNELSDDYVSDEKYEYLIEQYQKSIDDFRREYGEEYFEENEGYFWSINETRPFMQLLFDQSQLLWLTGKKNRAIEQFKYLLKLNPNDNQGVRDYLLPALLELNLLDEAESLFLKYEKDFSAVWKFSKLLLDIKKNVSFDIINNDYKACVETNKYVFPMLLGDKTLPDETPDYYIPGDENEAIYYLQVSSNVWLDDENAMNILKELSKN